MQSAGNELPNNTRIHPPGFYIIGLNTMPHTNIYVIFLSVLYMVTIMCNVFLISIIFYERRLHVPKFMAVGNLAVVDLVLSSSLVPSMIKAYLFLDNFVPFKWCLLQMYTYYAFLSLESMSLCVLAYDRMIAICFPLRQETLNTNTKMAYIIGGIWCFAIGVIIYGPTSITYLSFCGSVKVNSYFCDYAPVFRLACSDISQQWIFATSLSILLMFLPFSFIFLTYTCILICVFRMKSIQNRYKALATCSEHLILVALFFIPVSIVFNLGFFGIVINPNVRAVVLSITSCLTPCVNPILYSLKTKEVRVRAYVLFIQRMSVHPLRKMNINVD
ncbi:Olfactory receptor 2AG2 [Triplophysa tibetana]|uniref:Olfactory receptor 2AG2 n=1 Tax=Triplophysa tibetana TaxID=1572043 RepID=A0A5A9N4Q5_9TELE|nr:Olfactory receptor 2AG2 [Triplophysa tibetana]